MVLRRGATARRIGTGGHRPFAGGLGTQVVRSERNSSERAVARASRMVAGSVGGGLGVALAAGVAFG